VKKPAFPVNLVPIRKPLPWAAAEAPGLGFALMKEEDLESPPRLVFVVILLFKVFCRPLLPLRIREFLPPGFG
jgi:hypothetical protein